MLKIMYEHVNHARSHWDYCKGVLLLLPTWEYLLPLPLLFVCLLGF